MPTPQQVLQQVFGFDAFKPLQHEIIDNILAGRDTLVIMPTGGGKSLTYQVPALVLPGLTVVVSPLIALMQDQVSQLQALGIPAVFINSSLAFQEQQNHIRAIKNGEVKLLYVAPEALLTPKIKSVLASVQLSLLAIDEAHCISEWGHDFRPEYRQISEIRREFPSTVCMALTATATPKIRQDIMNSLAFSQANEFLASFDRDNLFLEVVRKKDVNEQIIQVLQQFKGQSGIIYCFSRNQVDELTEYLRDKGYNVAAYHAGLSDQERRETQNAFLRDNIQIMVATVAFGMGINKSNVRFVVHYHLPKSLEGYYQEIGRAGRDGLPARCVLFYSAADAGKLQFFCKEKTGLERDAAYKHIEMIKSYAETGLCRRKPLLSYFGESYQQDGCKTCDNCNKTHQDSVDITIFAQKLASCVKRSGEKFGLNHIIDILRGSKVQKVLQYQHDQLSTYGIGKELSKSQWSDVARQLIEKGWLYKEPEYSVLSVTEQGMQAMKSRETIFGEIQDATKKEQVYLGKNVENVSYNLELFEKLRTLRKILADRDNVPPYVVFSDKTLVEMSSYFPQSENGMLSINGVGDKKYEKYGQSFLDVIIAYCEEQEIEERVKFVNRRSALAVAEPKFKKVAEKYNQGRSIDELAEIYQISQGTVIGHLEEYVRAGYHLEDIAKIEDHLNVSVEQQIAAYLAFERLGLEYLRPIFEELKEAVSYDQIRLLRMCYIQLHQETQSDGVGSGVV